MNNKTFQNMGHIHNGSSKIIPTLTEVEILHLSYIRKENERGKDR
jgi:hypothetical protein